MHHHTVTQAIFTQLLYSQLDEVAFSQRHSDLGSMSDLSFEPSPLASADLTSRTALRHAQNGAEM